MSIDDQAHVDTAKFVYQLGHPRFGDGDFILILHLSPHTGGTI